MTVSLVAVLDRSADAPIHCHECDGFAVAYEQLVEPPQPTVEAMRRHDRLLRALMASCESVLPARFGSVFTDLDELLDAVREKDDWQKLLETVRGREQATLRLFLPDAPMSAPPPDWGPGRRHLEKLRQPRKAGHEALEWLLAQGLGQLVRASLVESSHDKLTTVFQLVDRGAGRDWRKRVEALAPEVSRRFDVRLEASGPWPPYAFASEVAS